MENQEKKEKHPKYGYDQTKVKKILCLMCDEPISDEPYVEETILARLGQMLFSHTRCSQPAKPKRPAKSRPPA